MIFLRILNMVLGQCTKPLQPYLKRKMIGI